MARREVMLIKISRLIHIGIVLAMIVATAPAMADPLVCTSIGGAPTDPVLQINASISEAKRGRVVLEINWYIEQENLAIQPTTADIIAILIGARSQEYKVRSTSAVDSGGRSGRTKVVINHEEQIISPRDVHFSVTVALKRDSKSAGLPARTKEFVLRVAPTD